ncbi:hypothetical protein J2752_000443 [Halarchaeum rubridurum]|uniref:Uncharacterized protein n=1 Tax=Halarchaeum rubridurum TaxID=489911 RepID=A0A830FV77_9EURY|nr:hypothetical protein [Halarchaeum rubridurum]MBP1953562.1 hypothetical protein [Halarchaeum rubridurum]GGM64369.1 hypothetical protein GCM10009017_12990 [Halarchaeum rubridurum]
MSSTTSASSTARPKRPSHYAERARAGDETWLEDCIEDVLGLRVSDAQREICRSVASNQKTLVVTANGLGKSYILAAIANAWLYVLYPATVLATSGTEKKMKRTFCKPVEALHDSALDGAGLPGEFKHRPERIDFPDDPEHWFEATSPQDAGELEGVHSAYHLSIIEEADKDDVDAETVDAMDSLVTDERDRMIAIANPPVDETNIVADLLDKPTWNDVSFSSFASHNVQVELGEAEGPQIDGLATLWKIKEDWREFNEEDWPGVEEARTVSDPTSPEFRDNLDQRWYRRRAGVIPPAGASANRPWTVDDVKAAWERAPSSTRVTPYGTGIDFARAGDETVVASIHADRCVVHYAESGTNHTQQESRIRHGHGEFGGLDDYPAHPGALDAVGEGSGIADRLCQAYPDFHRFNAGQTADDDVEYKDCWTEALAVFGRWLKEGGCIQDRDLYEQALVAARVVEYEEKFYASHGDDGAEVLVATSKQAIKDQLDGSRSPDYLDAAIMAAFAAEGKRAGGGTSGTGVWGSN